MAAAIEAQERTELPDDADIWVAYRRARVAHRGSFVTRARVAMGVPAATGLQRAVDAIHAVCDLEVAAPELDNSLSFKKGEELAIAAKAALASVAGGNIAVENALTKARVALADSVMRLRHEYASVIPVLAGAEVSVNDV